MSNKSISTLNKIILNQSLEKFNDNTIKILNLDDSNLKNSLFDQLLPSDIKEKVIYIPDILLYYAVRVEIPSITIIYNLLAHYRANIGDLNSLLLLRDVFEANQDNEIYKNCYKMIIDHIYANFKSTYSPEMKLDALDKIYKKNEDNTWKKIINKLSTKSNYDEYAMLVYKYNKKDIDILFIEATNSINHLINLTIFGDNELTNRIWTLINTKFKNRPDYLYSVNDFISSLFASGNIKLIEEYLIKIYDDLLNENIENDNIIMSDEILYLNLYSSIIMQWRNLYDITLLRIISRINQLPKIKLIIWISNNKIPNKHNISNLSFDYKVGKENINKLNQRYNLHLFPENFKISNF